MSFQNKRSKNNKIIILAVVFIAALLGWKFLGDKFSSSGKGKGKDAVAAVRVTVSPAIKKDIPLQLQLVGTVYANETVSIKSRLDSQIVSVLFKDGDYVAEGQVLFELDDRTIKAQASQLEADLQKEKAQLENARLQYERSKQLVSSSAVSQSRVDETKATYEAQKATMNSVQASLDNMNVQLGYSKITAPICGRAGTINVTRGNNVKANDTQALVTINQVKPIRVQFAIPQRQYDKVRESMAAGNSEVLVRRSEGGENSVGKLEYIDNNIDVSSGTFIAKAKFDNEDEKLWPGMFVTVTVQLGIENGALTIPAVAVQGDETNRFVFALDSEGKKAVKKPIKISRMAENIAVVSEGISEGDKVITDGLLKLSDGSAVEVPAAKQEEPVKSEVKVEK